MVLPSYREELSSQIPALQVLMALGYEYLTPREALESSVSGAISSNELAPIMPFADFDTTFAAIQAVLDIQNIPTHPERFHLSKDFQ